MFYGGGGGKSKSIVSEFVDTQNILRDELDAMTNPVAVKDIQIASFEKTFVKEGEEGTNLNGKLKDENVTL